ncbi:MAG: hypothetical protein U0231_15585 [Nitrospiraceae bacterium]
MKQHRNCPSPSWPKPAMYRTSRAKSFPNTTNMRTAAAIEQAQRRSRFAPLAQIVGLVDTYDGMVSFRNGRTLLPHDGIRQLFVLGEKRPIRQS